MERRVLPPDHVMNTFLGEEYLRRLNTGMRYIDNQPFFQVISDLEGRVVYTAVEHEKDTESDFRGFPLIETQLGDVIPLRAGYLGFNGMTWEANGVHCAYPALQVAGQVERDYLLLLLYQPLRVDPFGIHRKGLFDKPHAVDVFAHRLRQIGYSATTLTIHRQELGTPKARQDFAERAQQGLLAAMHLQQTVEFVSALEFEDLQGM